MIWEGIQSILFNMLDYEEKIHYAVLRVADFIAGLMQSQAQEHAPWTDRTGNARQGLEGFVEEVSETIIDIYLTHGMDYGVYLETRWAGRWAIIWPTIQEHLPIISDMLQDILT